MHKRGFLATAIAALLVGASDTAVAAVSGAQFADRWIDPGEALELRFDDPALHEAPLRVLIGRDDYSGVTRWAAPGVLLIDTSVAGLAAGTLQMVVYHESAEGWRELGRFPLRVRTRAGFEEAEVSPRLDLSNKSQWNEGRRGDTPPPPRSTYHDLAGSLQLETRHTRASMQLDSRFRFVGSSVQREALRFGQLRDDAPKIDLSDFLLGMTVGAGTKFELGHLSVGDHPLLIQHLSSRGVQASGSLGQRFDYRGSAVAGQQVTGYNRLLGADFDGNTITTGTIGFNPLLGQPQALRLELAVMDAERPSQAGFNIGEVTDAEKSRGIGLVLKTRTPGGRVGAEVAWALSRYDNPEDPLLSFGQPLVPVIRETNAAWQAALQASLLRDRPIGTERHANLDLQLNYQRVDPLYRSLGAFVQPDLQQFGATLSGRLGLYTLQLRFAEQEDNLDRIPTVLKTRTRSTGADLGWPLGALRAEATDGRSAWPNLSLRTQRIHQFAANVPDPIASEFNSPSHLPDQVTTQYGLQASWSLPRGSLGYSLSFSDQDNRQPGRERADFQSLNHGLNLGWSPWPSLSLNVGLMRGRNGDREQALARYNDSISAGINWRLGERSTLNLNWQQGRNHDSLAQAEARNESFNGQLASQVNLPMGPRRVPAQFFVAYSRQASTQLNRLFGFDNEFGTWSINSGLSFSF